MNSFNGHPIVSSPLAVSPKWVVEKMPIRKRRRNWRVAKIEIPACYRMGNTLVMHPALIAQLRNHNKDMKWDMK